MTTNPSHSHSARAALVVRLALLGALSAISGARIAHAGPLNTDGTDTDAASRALDADSQQTQPNAKPDMKRTETDGGLALDACARALGSVEDGTASLAIVDSKGRALVLEMMQRDPGTPIRIQSRTGMRVGETYFACFSSSLPCPEKQDDPGGTCGDRINQPTSGWNADRLVIPLSSRAGERFKHLKTRPGAAQERVSIPLENVPYILVPLRPPNPVHPKQQP